MLIGLVRARAEGQKSSDESRFQEPFAKPSVLDFQGFALVEPGSLCESCVSSEHLESPPIRVSLTSELDKFLLELACSATSFDWLTTGGPCSEVHHQRLVAQKKRLGEVSRFLHFRD